MKQFSLVKNDRGQFPELPQGLAVVYGYKRNAITNMDYDGNAKDPAPKDVENEWFPLSRDFDSTMAWHGGRKREGAENFERVQILWKQ